MEHLYTQLERIEKKLDGCNDRISNVSERLTKVESKVGVWAGAMGAIGAGIIGVLGHLALWPLKKIGVLLNL